jgi:hypothetical protein
VQHRLRVDRHDVEARLQQEVLVRDACGPAPALDDDPVPLLFQRADAFDGDDDGVLAREQRIRANRGRDGSRVVAGHELHVEVPLPLPAGRGGAVERTRRATRGHARMPFGCDAAGDRAPPR